MSTNSPNRGDDTFEAANGPQNATQRVRDLIALEVAAAEGVDSGAIGRLNEAERVALRLQVRQALVTAWRDDYSVATVVSGVAECLEGHLAALVREHTDRALAEVEQRIASSVSHNFALRRDGSEDPQAAAYVEGLRDAHAIVRAARQERGR